jgi:thiol-disulfide isomerase/thioredoxin
MKKLTYLILLLFAFQTAVGQSQLDTALNFSVKDIYGNNIELFPILDEGKLVVIDFFNTSCGPCGLYAPDIQASYEDFGENAGNVHFLNIAWGDDNNGVAYFDSIHGITIPSVSGSQGGGNQVYTNYMVLSTPTVILIAPDRLILEHYIWEPTQENINAAIIAAGGSMVGIDDETSPSENNLLVYPNPSKGMVNVRVESNGTALYRLETYNLVGSKVSETAPTQLSAGSHILTTDLGHLPEGTYFVRLIRNEEHENLSRVILLN